MRSMAPLGFLESRTGTTPCEAARFAATSTQTPPLSLYEDLNQWGIRSRHALSYLIDQGHRCRLRKRLSL